MAFCGEEPFRPPADASVLTRFDELGADGRPHRLGILGGTFDPIHNAHLAIAECAMCDLGLDGVLFVVAGDPWMKRGRALASAEDRFVMVCAAIANEPSFAASRIEIDRAGETYTVDTLRELRVKFPRNVELVFLMGSDSLEHVDEWCEASSLGGLARFAVVSMRPGSELDEASLAKAAKVIGAAAIERVDMAPMELSSTDLREKTRAGQSIRDMVPAVVADYIEVHGLYR